ncbi:MAG TPA: septum formation initiator family protein [Verrucomicrobiae bacterium]|nr:septum formation initiator family protein [Verrucomicrobiae bacterium]
MKVDLGIWSKLTRVVIVLLGLAGFLGVAVWYLPLINQNEKYRKEILRLDLQNQRELDTNKVLRGQIEALQHDPKTVERLARERLNYAKPGETIFHFDEQPTTNNPAPR